MPMRYRSSDEDSGRWLDFAFRPGDIVISTRSKSGTTWTTRPPPSPRPPLHEWLLTWIDQDIDPREELDSLPGVAWHLSDAWGRRAESNVVLVHYDDLSADLDGEMRRLAASLGVTVPDSAWPQLVEAATFEFMRARADRLAPDPSGVLKSRQAFFRQGTSGSGRALLSDEQRARYRARAAQLAPPDLLAWLHRDVAAPPAGRGW